MNEKKMAASSLPSQIMKEKRKKMIDSELG
jgi:hypothetical protein